MTFYSEKTEEQKARDRRAYSDLIGLAEAVQNQRAKLRRQFINIAGLCFLFSIIAAVSSIVVVVTIQGVANVSAGFFAAIAGLFIAVNYAAFGMSYLVYRRLDRRELSAFREVMAITHEVLESMKSDLSPLEMAEVRIRLLRLDN
ncbi:hypothetical protein LJR090_002516 [Bosea sp. LjRoot90]|uniref:hypothetical protein n=1 Tax=Bosea sp. LjRoot90 TaxID=3342342 RepID=UPI003ECF3B74